MVCMIIMLVIMMLAVICVHMVLVTILVLAMAVAVCLMAVPITMIVIMCMAGAVMCMLILGILHSHDGGQTVSSVTVLVILVLALFGVYVGLAALLVLAVGCDGSHCAHNMTVVMCIAGVVMCMPILGVLLGTHMTRVNDAGSAGYFRMHAWAASTCIVSAAQVTDRSAAKQCFASLI